MMPQNPHTSSVIIVPLSFFIYSSRSLKWTAMLIPFLPLASQNFICKEKNNLMRDCHITSKSQASKGYLPLQLQEMLTPVSGFLSVLHLAPIYHCLLRKRIILLGEDFLQILVLFFILAVDSNTGNHRASHCYYSNSSSPPSFTCQKTIITVILCMTTLV